MHVLVVEEVNQEWQVCFLETLMFNDFLSVLLEVLLQMNYAISPYFIIIILANADNQFEEQWILCDTLLAYILCDCENELVSSLTLWQWILEAGHVLQWFHHVVRDEPDLQLADNCLEDN